jgi:hypothetical protein
MNIGDEAVWVTHDGGQTWLNITGNLVLSTGTVGMSRPAGLEFVDDIDGEGTTAVLVGTVSGAFATFITKEGKGPLTGMWARVGTCLDFPLTLTPSIVYEAYSNTLVVGTFGRGVYILENAKSALWTLMHQQLNSRCETSTPPNIPTNEGLLPTPYVC